jgi:DNA-binding SARP family transcriptional activator/ABC-type branched-subunit amino acid transport system substrate-binding protein
LQFRLLGLLEVEADGKSVRIVGGRESALLALLLLHANQPLSTERIVDELWGEEPTANASKSVHIYVSRLRKALGADRIETTQAGYRIHLAPDELDSERFARLAAAGKRREALALWRGEPLADFRFEPFAQNEIRRLEALRDEVWLDELDARLADGRASQAVPELEAVIERQPLWERPRAQLMRGLYLAGRQADALALYRTTRTLLHDQLGVEPGPELQRLEQAILNHDPALGRPSRRLLPLRRRRGPEVYLVLAAGVGLIAAALVAAAVVVFRGDSSRSLGNAVAAVDTSGRSVSYTSAGTTPGNVVVGEGGVWVLDADDRTITRIDPKTRRVVKTFATSAEPTDLAVGDGAIWVGSAEADHGEVETGATTNLVSRVDPASTDVATSTHLPGPEAAIAAQTLGVSGIAVGPHAVWALDPDGSISRIDPATGHLVAHVEAKRAAAIAAGDAGAWFLTTTPTGTPAVARIDPRTNTVDQTIPVATSDLVGIAVGAGSVWATNPFDGVIWRIIPGSATVERTIPVGFGATQVAFGGGAIWTANLANGTVSRIDPRTNDVTATRQLAGTPQALAAGDGSAWVSVAGATSSGSLPRSDCGPVEPPGATPDVIVASDMPLQGPSAAKTFAAAVRFVLRSHGFRAGQFTVGYQSCDDSTARSQGSDFFKCATNARDFGADAKLVAVIGPYDSPCTQIEIPVTNRASAGPVALVSPSTTSTAFTRTDRGAAARPQIYYPTGVRNFMRLASPDDLQGAAQAVLAKQLQVTRIAVLTDGEPYGDALVRGFRAAARRLGVKVVAAGNWQPGALDDSDLVARVARAHANGVLLAGYSGGAEGLIRALRARFGGGLPLIAGDGFLAIPDTLKMAGTAAKGMYLSDSLATTENLTPAGKRLVSAFEQTQPGARVPTGTYLPEELEAAQIVIDAIAHSNGSRASVLQQLRLSKLRTGLFGGFHFDRNGDITPGPFTIFRITGGRGTPGLAPDYRGSVVDRTIRVPTGLLDTVPTPSRK